VSRSAWALLGVPAVFAGASYLLAMQLGKHGNGSNALLVIWIATLVFLIASGFKALIGITPAGRLLRIVIGLCYLGGMYVLLLGVGFISMCAFGGCGI